MLYSSSKQVILLFLNVSVIPLIIRCIYQGEKDFYVLALAAIVIYFLLKRLIESQHAILVQNIQAKIHNQQMSLEDPLTGLGNRRRLEIFAEKLFSVSQRTAMPFQLAIFDVDYFKQFNDTHGHIAGDNILNKVGEIILANVRKGDLAVRYGGEEFMVIMPATDEYQAIQIVERICQHIKEDSDITVSAGISGFRNQLSFDSIIKEADEALYFAKSNGRDQFIVAK